jgi:hypothetical protein
MALPDLAAAADLSARGVTPTAVHDVMLAVASSIVRSGAASPIVETDSVVTLTAWGDRFIELPGLPVRSVESVTVDGVSVTDWKLTDTGRLWRAGFWGSDSEPVAVEVTMTHGLPVVPPHIVQMVCDLAISGANSATAGAHDPNVIAEKIDDYSVTFASGAEAVASAMELPTLTKRWLRAQFGGGAGVVTYR